MDNSINVFVGEFMARFRLAPRAGLPRFCGGLVGSFGYDTVRYIEPKLAKVQKPDELGTPDVLGTVALLEKRGVEFLATDRVHSSERGALTKPLLGGMMFELVKSTPPGGER